MKDLNTGNKNKSFAGAPFDFLPRRWIKHVVLKSAKDEVTLSRPHYEPALLTTLNERLKSGDVTVSHSRRWTDFEEYLIPRSLWAAKRIEHYAHLELPLDADEYLARLNDQLKRVMGNVERRIPHNKALTIDAEKGEFHLAALKALDRPDSIKVLKELIESRLPKSDLADVLIDIDNRTNFLHHFLPPGAGKVAQRRNALAAVLAIGCNIGCQPMALASGLGLHEISLVADWYLMEETLKAATIDIINFRLANPCQPRLRPRCHMFGGRHALLRAYPYPRG